MDIIALFCDIDYFLFLGDTEILAYSNGRNSAGWDLHIFFGGFRGSRDLKMGTLRSILKQLEIDYQTFLDS